MRRKPLLTEVLKAVRATLKEQTEEELIDFLSEQQLASGLYVDVEEQMDASTDTRWKETYLLAIHHWIPENSSLDQVYEGIESIEQAMEQQIAVAGGQVVVQTPQGLHQIAREANGMKHTIIRYSIQILYGYKTKTLEE